MFDFSQVNAEEAKALFNGTDLSGWSGDPRLWSVRDGVIHGETTRRERGQGKHVFDLARWQGQRL